MLSIIKEPAARLDIDLLPLGVNTDLLHRQQVAWRQVRQIVDEQLARLERQLGAAGAAGEGPTILPLPARQRSGPKPAARPGPTKNDKRDAWIYKQRQAGQALMSIRIELDRIGPAREWDTIASEQGIYAAAKRYAQAHGLPVPLRPAA